MAGAEAETRDILGPGAKNKYFRLHNNDFISLCLCRQKLAASRAELVAAGTAPGQAPYDNDSLYKLQV